MPHRVLAVFSICALLPLRLAAGNAAAPNPPVIPYEARRDATAEVQAPAGAGMTEWTFHKSGDGSDPSWAEQRMMWLMNRARSDPTAEGIWLAESDHPDVANGRDFFNVDLDQLKSDFAALDVMAPAAFDIRLHDASMLHSEDLIARDAQDHDGQFDKVAASGFDCNGARLSVFSFADSALNAHAALNIDWGNNPPSGVQDPPGHRLAIMGVFQVSLSNVGLAMVPENNQNTQVGPLVFSGAYCHAGVGDNNRFIVGTVWTDLDMDGEYDEGEGLPGVTVMPDSSGFFAVTGDAGGYAIPITAPGTYEVTFSGGGLGGDTTTRSVTVGAESALLDLNTAEVPPVPLLLRRETDSRWFMYMVNYHNGMADTPDKGLVSLTRSFAFQTVSRDDFDGDGEGDLLARDLTGEKNFRWLLYTFVDRTITAQGFVELTRNTDWQVVATKDINGDGRTDVLLRNTVNGRWLAYLMDGHTILDQGQLAMSQNLGDTFVGSGDFDGDGDCDVLLRRANGTWLMYALDGLNAPVPSQPAMTSNLAFSVQAIGHFNDDDQADVLLRRADGRWFLYLLNGATIVDSGAPAMSENPAFSLVASDDFNGDGTDDALLRRTDGIWFLYTLNGLTIVDQGSLNMTKNTAFGVVLVADFNDDGIADALLRRSDGRWVLYLIDGTGPTIIAQGVPPMTKNTAWIPQVD